jgi:hypothetical protein
VTKLDRERLLRDSSLIAHRGKQCRDAKLEVSWIALVFAFFHAKIA